MSFTSDEFIAPAATLSTTVSGLPRRAERATRCFRYQPLRPFRRATAATHVEKFRQISPPGEREEQERIVVLWSLYSASPGSRHLPAQYLSALLVSSLSLSLKSRIIEIYRAFARNLFQLARPSRSSPVNWSARKREKVSLASNNRSTTIHTSCNFLAFRSLSRRDNGASFVLSLAGVQAASKFEVKEVFSRWGIEDNAAADARECDSIR